MIRAAFVLSSLLVACQDLGPGATEPGTKPVLSAEPACPGGRDGELQRGQWVKIYENPTGINPYARAGRQAVCIVR